MCNAIRASHSTGGMGRHGAAMDVGLLDTQFGKTENIAVVIVQSETDLYTIAYRFIFAIDDDCSLTDKAPHQFALRGGFHFSVPCTEYAAGVFKNEESQICGKIFHLNISQ